MEINVNDYVSYLRKYIGKSVDELCEIFDIHTNAKSKNSMIASKMSTTYFDEKELTGLEPEFKNVVCKTISLKENGNPEEGMSFKAINYMELVKEDWYDSTFRNYLVNSIFVFFVFQCIESKVILINIFKWQVPIDDLDGEIKDVWEDTKDKLLSGNVIRDYTGGKIKTTFERESQTQICHVRPHGQTGRDLSPIPVVDIHYGFSEIPKHSFWFNHSYIIKILSGCSTEN